MLKFIEILNLFSKMAGSLSQGNISLNTPLEEIVIKVSGDELAYIDNRKDALGKYGYSLWKGLDANYLVTQGIDKGKLYSESAQFPDFLFRTKLQYNKLICGSLLELKDSKSGSIASFNSTLPTKSKSLEEIDIINGTRLVSKIASLLDGDAAYHQGYYTFQRSCFYLVRTCKDKPNVKLSIVDGSFFETLPKKHLINKMLMNILQEHLSKEQIHIPSETLKQVEDVLSHINDQTIIASSQLIEKASVRPRLRIMAEVHPEGNPHSQFYPQISEGSLNLVLQSSPDIKEIKDKLTSQIPSVNTFIIKHKRNGEHVVFQLKT
jgi:hypothetical protein